MRGEFPEIVVTRLVIAGARNNPKPRRCRGFTFIFSQPAALPRLTVACSAPGGPPSFARFVIFLFHWGPNGRTLKRPTTRSGRPSTRSGIVCAEFLTKFLCSSERQSANSKNKSFELNGFIAFSAPLYTAAHSAKEKVKMPRRPHKTGGLV
jgi:hypothetical protein